jgi:DNA repair protein RAD50
MEGLENGEEQIENEINERLENVERLQEELNNEKQKVEELRKELEKLRKKKEQEKLKENNEQEESNKRKRKLEELSTKRLREEDNRKKRMKKFKEELLKEDSSEENEFIDDSEEIIEQEDLSDLSNLFLLACKKEKERDELNGKIISYWYNFAEEYKRRTEELIKGNFLMTDKVAMEILNEEITKETGWNDRKLADKLKGARKIYYIFSRIGKEEIEKIKETRFNTILHGRWEEIKGIVEDYFREMEKNRFEKIKE